ASGRVTQYAAAHTQPLAEVRERVRAALVTERAAEMAAKEGSAKLAAWKANPATATGLPSAVTVSRDQPQKEPRQIIDAALQAATGALPAWVGVNLGADGYAVVKVNRLVERGAVPDETAQRERQQYGQAWTGAESLAYYDLLKTRMKTQIKVDKPAAQLP
ncbi:MAG TPA: peptidyl-prolyl cis-trans isomerase, partial [Burkholderiaceae bacterium]